MTSRPVTALLLVDVINSFFRPGDPNYYPQADQVLEPIRQLLDKARASGTLVVHTAERHREGIYDFEWAKLPIHHIEGDDTIDFVEGFGPLSGEPVVHKRRYSAFYATDMALMLREQNVSRLVIVGVKTNCCIRATVQDAFAGGFEPVVVREATNSNRPHLEEASLEDIWRYFGQVVPLSEGLELLA